VPGAIPRVAANSLLARSCRVETYFFCSIFCLPFYGVLISVSGGGGCCVSIAISLVFSLALSLSVPSWLLVGGASAFAVVPVVLSICVVSPFSFLPVVSSPGRLIVMSAMSVVVP
jgi:hypothetical protein